MLYIYIYNMCICVCICIYRESCYYNNEKIIQDTQEKLVRIQSNITYLQISVDSYKHIRTSVHSLTQSAGAVEYNDCTSTEG